MATKYKKMFDKTEFSKILLTLSLKEVIQIEFRTKNVNKLNRLVVCTDELKKKYSCNVCKVVQYGNKNLISHLHGKKHLAKMESVTQLFLPKFSEENILINKYNNVKELPVSNKVECSRDKEKAGETQNPSDPIKLNQQLHKNKTLSTGIEAKNKEPKIPNFNLGSNKHDMTNMIRKVKITNIDNNRKTDEDDDITVNSVFPHQFNKQLVQQSAVKCESNGSNYSESIGEPTCGSESKVNYTDVNATNAETITEKLSLTPDIGGNPTPSTRKTNISCVPISKLIGNSKAGCSVPTSIVPIRISNRNKSKNNDELDVTNQCLGTGNVKSQNSVTFVPTSNCDSIFDSNSTITEILGLLGVEYVIKIMRNLNDGTAKYFCTLCNITTDEKIMNNHIQSYTHRLTYCEKHFPTALRQYRQYISHIPEHHIFKILPSILEKLAKAIEKYHGRETVYPCYEYSFSKNKQRIISTVFNRKHASEMLGPAFTHVVDLNEVELLIENSSNYKFPAEKTSTINNDNLLNTCNPSNHTIMNQNVEANFASHPFNEDHRLETVDDETHKRMVDMFLRETRQNQRSCSRQPSRTPKRSRSRSNSNDRKRIRSNRLIISQWNVERKSLSPLRDDDVWQAYRHLVDHNVRDLNTKYDLYKSDPEEHPMYKEEWQNFWKRRKDELIAAGINHRSYNFQNEWILFFNSRLEELYNRDIENIKIKCRERLCLPMTNDDLSNSKYHVHTPENLLKCEESIKNDDSKRNINIIHVLRLLTALEGHLGSLGPSITALLAKALQICKLNPEKANTSLLTGENCAILETAKEKFTGLIISKMLDLTQERALRKAINATEELLEHSKTLQLELETNKTELNRNIHENETPSRVANMLYPNQDRLDTTELASKLATSLISQGKTSINQEQLEQIVQFYSIMEKRKQQGSTPSSNSVNNVENYSTNVSINKQNIHHNNPLSEEEISNLNTSTDMSENYELLSYNYDPISALTRSKHNMKLSENDESVNMARANKFNIKQTEKNEILHNGRESQYRRNERDQLNNRDSTIHNNYEFRKKIRQSYFYKENNN
ncbi:PREDICTED: uncharacterized protein LOC108618335 [Drosophila arizonae]|uniref:Uncharacterized protein LOC108618335 n=1 Tax=Drosophila arizonae TaxID=7263 RepID=A0ABM1PRG1_DROAR|nr:PREDICTED: uncharacterized protein LOC108618335 [Drosophila arizonae]